MLEGSYLDQLQKLMEEGKLQYSDFDLLTSVLTYKDKSEPSKTKAREVIANLVDNNIIDHETYRVLFNEIVNGKPHKMQEEGTVVSPYDSEGNAKPVYQEESNKPLRGVGLGVLLGSLLGFIGVLLALFLGDSQFRKGVWIGLGISILLDLISSLLLVFMM